MGILFSIVMLGLILAIVAFVGTEGLFSSGIMLFNVLFGALLSMNFWEPLAQWLQGMMPGGEYFWPAICMIGLWGIFTVLLRTITDRLAPEKVEFPKLVDQIGGYFFAAWTGWVIVCFVMVALQVAPLARNFFFEGFNPEKPSFFGMVAPDRMWLGFSQRMSYGPLAPITSKSDSEDHWFDPQGEFLLKHAAHRERYASQDSVSAGMSGVRQR